MANNFRDKVLAELNKKFGDKVKAVEDISGDTIEVSAGIIVDVMKELRDKFELPLLVNLTATEYESNFTMAYQVTSVKSPDKINVKAVIDKVKPEIASITSVYPAANVQEREAYDLIGIIFKGHPNLKRILLPDDWEGHPLRKDYKL